jgi:Glycosyl transferase family 2
MSAPARNGRPLVKVVVPCYEYAEYLPGCIRSILDQEGVSVRVLIVDDCSPDDTPAVAGRLGSEDERVEYHRNERNLGLIRSVNRGLEWAADSDYVVVLSADDLLAPGALQRSVGVMESHPEVGLTYGRAVHFESGRPLPDLDRRWRGTKIRRGEDWIRIRCRMGHNCIASPEAVVRTSVQRRVGLYDLPSHHASELNMWLRIAAVSDVAYVRGAAQALYRIHPDSMLRTMLKSGAMTDVATRRTAFEGFFATAGAELAEGRRLRDTARRALAKQALWRASRAYDRGQLDDAEGTPAQEWVDFALETYPDARRLREWRGLWLRRKIGAGRSLLFPPFLATGASQRLRSIYYRLRLQTRGI